MPGTGPGSGAGAAGVAMRVHAEHAVRLGVVALAAALAGCVTPPEPYGGDPPPPPPPSPPREPAGGARPRPPPGSPAGRGPRDEPGRPAAQPTGTGDVVRTAGAGAAPAPAGPPGDDGPTALTLGAAVGYGLEHNPALTAVRTQRGVAQAGVVIARQYPFNPVLQVFELGANGPAASGVTNHAFNETTMRLDLELRGQGRIRQAGAAATLTRTEWDI